MKTVRRMWLWALLLLVGLSGCASTSLLDVWYDRDYSGPKLQRLLVVGFTEKERNRRIFEDEFVEQLNRIEGIEATASIRLIPAEKGLGLVRPATPKMVTNGITTTGNQVAHSCQGQRRMIGAATYARANQ